MHSHRVSSWSVVAAVLAAGLLAGAPAWAQEPAYPRKPITFVVPNEAGSALDSLSRPLADLMQKELGQPIIIVNKPGGAGTIGLREVHGARPDGYTIGISATAHYAKLVGLVSFDHHDLTILGIPAAGVPTVMVPADRPWKTVAELVDQARSHPGELKVATTSRGGYWWLATKSLEKHAGLKLNVLAQPGGGAMVVNQVAGGHVDFGVAGLAESRSQVQAGNVRILAVFGQRRVPGYEQIPPLSEAGYKIEMLGVTVLVAPKDLPKPVHDALMRAYAAAVKSPVFDKTMRDLGSTPLGLGSDEAFKYLEEQVAVMRPILADAGLLK